MVMLAYALCDPSNSRGVAWRGVRYDTILANARFFNGDVSKVPRSAVTVGVGTVMDAREVLIIITGAHKALALSQAVEQGVSHMVTVSALQMHRRACIGAWCQLHRVCSAARRV